MRLGGGGRVRHGLESGARASTECSKSNSVRYGCSNLRVEFPGAPILSISNELKTA